jgi:hypothetical protein
MQPRHAIWWFVVGACVPVAEPLPLAEMPELAITLSPWSSWLSVELANVSDADGACAVLADDVSAEVNGAPMEITGRGGFDTANEGFPCSAAHLSLTMPPQVDPAVFVLRDRSTTITVELGDRLLARDGGLLPSGNQDLYGGETYTIAWSPRSDLEAGYGVHLTRPDGMQLTLDSTLTDAGVEFTEPLAAVTLAGGSGQLELSAGHLTQVPCRAARCSVVTEFGLKLPVQLHLP